MRKKDLIDVNQLPEYEILSSGKTIIREFDAKGILKRETHGYGVLEIAINRSFDKGGITDEMYFVKKRMVSRRSYEKARANYSDMPLPNATVEDFSSALLGDLRKQRRRNRADAEKRLAESTESRYARPTSTNWLRVIAGERSHLVIFASRDWKVLSQEPTIRTGREWMRLFGFHGPPRDKPSLAEGLQIGYEMEGDRVAMLDATKKLLGEVINFAQNPPETSRWQGSIGPQPKPRKKPPLSWPEVLPPLIEFLSAVQEPNLKIFNHHL
jgi:hypothetical protein